MVVNEENSEQIQPVMLSRFARERLDLSVSVTETLREAPLADLPWPDDAFEYTCSGRTAYGKTIFPPRLSLQSRPMPAVRPGRVPFSSLGLPSALSSSDLEEWKSTTAAHNESVLLRFAQRLTASFVALRPEDSSAVSTLPSLTPKEGRSIPRTYDVSPLPFEPQTDMLKPVEPFSNHSSKKAHPPVPAPASMHRTPLRKNRLAGHAVKIRLETAPMPALSDFGEFKVGLPSAEKKGNVFSAILPGDDVSVTSARLPTVTKANSEIGGMETSSFMKSNGHSEISTTSTHLPIIDLLRKLEREISGHTPFTTMLKGHISGDARGALSGCGTIEAGQADVIVANPCITTSSVVLVTLTANPGPVVVQYISLQAQVGFTLHLTAPTTMKTSFNYIVLLSELF